MEILTKKLRSLLAGMSLVILSLATLSGSEKNIKNHFSTQAASTLASNGSPVKSAESTQTMQDKLMLWYRQPAKRWLEALPLGNGRIGAMVFGGVSEEKLALNETTFWSGEPSDQHENPEASSAFAKIRALFKAGKYSETQPLITKLLGRQLNYGTNLPAGDLLLSQSGTDGAYSEYRRELNLDQAVASVTFLVNGVHFRREILASHPDGVLALRLSADRQGSIGFVLHYQGGDFPWTVKNNGSDELVINGQAFEKKHSDGKCGVAFEALIRVFPDGGTMRGENGALHVDRANSATILIALNTDFRGANPAALCNSQIALAQNSNWKTLKERHIADYQRLFNRVSLDLGDKEVLPQPTDIRLKSLLKGQVDPALSALFFQYGRYLTIAGSREDSPLPMHLQGIWNDSFAANMGWTCDYHLDINTQQNYWPTEVANLSECGQPLFRFIESLQAPGQQTARKVYGINKGWVCHVFSNVWGYTAPGWDLGWGLHVAGGVWIATHLWEHYEFSGDREFLSKHAYPVLKGAAEFFLEYLYTDPTSGYLLTGPSVSPERGGEASPGCTHDRAMIHELFSECIKASKILGVDADFRARLDMARAKLPPYKIGRNGQLQEWFQTDDGGETNHRHTSHLVGLFPFAQITSRNTPELARATDKSLHLRMDHSNWEDVEWSAANAICYYARLGNGGMAHKNLINLLTSDSDMNMMTFARGGIADAEQNIFCVDGNTAGAAGIAEMLLQSHSGEIEFLPALPKVWPTGSFKGLCTRGGFEVDLSWKNGQLNNAQIHSVSGKNCQVRYGTKLISLDFKPGQTKNLDKNLNE